MKKLMIILVASLSITAASAQGRNDNYNKQERYQQRQSKDNWYNKDQHQSNDHAYGKGNVYTNNGRGDDRNRQAEYDRMNQQYDRRINGYRNDRSLNSYERDRRIRAAEQERQQQSNGFGKGLVIGAQ
jgi:uncharacterized protein YxeA